MVQQSAITVLLLVWPDGNEAPERARSASVETRMIGFLKMLRILGRVFSSSIMRTVCACFGRGGSMAGLAGALDGVLWRGERGIRKGKREGGAKDKCAPAKTAEDEKGNGCDDKARRPDIGITNGRHEQIENGIRPLLVNRVKNHLVHSIAPARCENKSARRTKQVTLVAAVFLSLRSASGQH